MIGGILCTIIEDGIFSPRLLLMGIMICGGLYCLKVERYRAKYIYINTDNRTLYIKTMFKGEFEYRFSDIKAVIRRNYGARFEFNDGIKIEFNKAHAEIETPTQVYKSMHNIIEEDFPGVPFIKKL